MTHDKVERRALNTQAPSQTFRKCCYNQENARDSMIGEIENRSSHLPVIKADVETEGEFAPSWVREVRRAMYTNMEDFVSLVKWLDDELSFLVRFLHFSMKCNRGFCCRALAGRHSFRGAVLPCPATATRVRTPILYGSKHHSLSAPRQARNSYRDGGNP